MRSRIATKSPPSRKRAAAPPLDERPASAASPQRSRVTNGSAFVLGDNRGPWVRRAKDLVEEYLGDIGGADYASTAERSLVRRIATLSVELESLESRFAHDGAASANDLDLYGRLCGHLRRCLETIGIKRRVRDVSVPSLADLLAAEDDLDAVAEDASP